jgi:glycine cleavage system H protein
MVPKDLRYTQTHEWARIDGDGCTVGVTQFAVEQLTDVVALEFRVGKGKKNTVAEGQPFGEIESVKAVSDLNAPVAGEVVEVNKAAADDPSLVAADPYGKGWLIKLKMAPGTTLDRLLTPEQYEQQIATQGH